MELRKCPECGVELRRGRCERVNEGGRSWLLEKYVCPNPNCTRGRAGGALLENMRLLAEGQQELSCCGRLLARAAGGSYWVAGGVTAGESQGQLVVVCPGCGGEQSLAIGECVRVY